MNKVSRTITGILGIILGTFLILLSFTNPWVLFYGIPVLVVGIFILFNKKEDEIEKIKGAKK
jgi:hypothetical protein